MNSKKYILALFLLSATTFGTESAQDTELKSELILLQDNETTDIVTITVTDQQENALSNVKVTESVSKQEYTTDDSGRFTCDLSDKTRYFYAVDKEHKQANYGRLQPGQKQLHIRLEPARVVTGKVVDIDGESVPGTIVEAVPMGPCVLSNNEGNFVIGWLASWEPRSGICLLARNVERNLATVVDISRQTENIEIQLAPALTLKGTVTNSQGRPISGARMILVLKKWTWGTFISQRIYVDDEGRFEFSVLPQLQEYELNIRADNYLDESFTIGQLNTIKETVEIAPVVLHQKQDTTNGIEYGQLFLNVVDEDGKPINITKIQLWDAKNHPSASKETFIATSTDKSGFYRIEEIPTGYHHVISIDEEGHAPFRQTDVLIEKDSAKTINCILSKGGIIEGLVVNEQGKPVEGIPVVIKSPLYSIGVMGDFITDANGRFHADYMPDMHYSVVAEPDSESPYETTVFRGDVLCGQKNIKIIVQNKKGTRLGASLVGKNLPEFESIKINLNPDHIQNRMMLFCFFDMNQRPSRNCILQLSKRAQELKAKDIVIAAVQTSKIEKEKLDEWIKENNIHFFVGMIEGDEEKTKFNWGVKSLPWLILTDKQHIVTAEGFSITELDEKIKQ